MPPTDAFQPSIRDYVFAGAKTITQPGVGTCRYDEHYAGSPVYTLGHGTSKVERTYVCRWEDRQKFVRLMLGYPKLRDNTVRVTLPLGGRPSVDLAALYPAPNDYFISRVIPHAITDIVDPTGGEPFLYAQSVTKMEGKGPKGTYDIHGVPEYHLAEVTVLYEAVTFKVTNDDKIFGSNKRNRGVEKDRYITRLRKPSAEYLALPRGIYKWYDATVTRFERTSVPVSTPGSKQAKVDFATSRLLPSMELIYHWHQVPFLPAALFQGYVGCVNRDRFYDSPGFSTIHDPRNRDGYAPGTLLLLSAEVKPYRNAVGAFVHDITYRMKYYEPEPGRGHNFFLRYKNSTNRLHFTKITEDGTNDEAGILIADRNRDGTPDNTGPYPASTLFISRVPGRSKAVYPYRNFYNLFAFQSDDPTPPVAGP